MLRGSRGFAPHCTAPLRAGRRKPCVCRLFLCTGATLTGTRSANCPYPVPPPRSRTSAAPAHTAVIDPKEPDTPAGICHPLRAHSPNRSAAGPHSTRRSGDRLHLSVISGGSVRSQERSRQETGRKEQKAGSFRRKMRRKSRQTRGFLQTVCGIRSAHKPTPCDDRAGKKNGPLSSFRGRGRTDLYRDTAHDGGKFS